MAAPVRIVLPALKWILGLWLVCVATLAHAQGVQLRDAMVVSAPPEAMAAPGDGDDWTWLSLRDPQRLRSMPGEWQLLIDQVRFQDIAVVAVASDGTVERQVLGADELERNWALGGLIRFDIATSGESVRELAVGFNRLDDLALMRKVTAASPEQAAALEARWLVLMGLFCGLVISGFAYNLFVNAGHRPSFQRWYLGWVVASLAYGLTWSNLGAYVVPHLAGPVAVRLNNLLISLTVALASMFLISVLEQSKVPPRLLRLIEVVALACIASGVIAADERIVPAWFGDRLLNVGLLLCVVISVVAIAIAALRLSRVVWLYLLGWSPLIAVFTARLVRNLGFAPQSDLVDMATFAAIGFESLVFSLVLADRFLTLKRERDQAAASAREMEVEKETLRRAAHSDFLTGLGNRAAFHGAMRERFDRRARFTLFLIDVDFLKEQNDRQGHDAGDALLRHLGGELATLAGQGVSCSRIGGDEFAVLCDGEPDAARVSEALDRLQGALWVSEGWSGTLSLSIGVASSDNAVSSADLFQQADVALYEAKKLGRARRQTFDDRMRGQIQTRLDLIREAHWGLCRSEFELHFQPIADLRSGKLIGVEGLLRWRHPERGLLTPETFGCVLADEEIGAAVQQRVIALAIEELRSHPAFAGTLAVNFTAMDLDGPERARGLLAKLAKAGIAPERLCVEVTEGILIDKAGETAGALRILHEAGVRIALDDFGTGYASLVHLKEIPVDTLKIDMSFISGLLDDEGESEAIVRAVLALGHGLKKTVIAEGVETAAQLERLRELGCDLAQGYLFGRPTPVFGDKSDVQIAA